MSQKVRIITDSGCDISPEAELKWSHILTVMPFSITLNGESFTDRKDFTPEQFYKLLKDSDEIPKHAQLTPMQFEDEFRSLYDDGAREIIVDVINGAGSQTYSNAVLAKQNVADLADLKVYTVDSRNYTLCYGYPILEACRKIEEGQDAPPAPNPPEPPETPETSESPESPESPVAAAAGAQKGGDAQ